jgi:hypothetical protein
MQSPAVEMAHSLEHQSAAMEDILSPPPSPEPSSWNLLNVFGSPRAAVEPVLPTQTSFSLGVYWEQASLAVLRPQPGQDPILLGLRLDRGCLQANKVENTLNALVALDMVALDFRNVLSLHVRSLDRDRSAYISSSLWASQR